MSRASSSHSDAKTHSAPALWKAKWKPPIPAKRSINLYLDNASPLNDPTLSADRAEICSETSVACISVEFNTYVSQLALTSAALSA